MVEAIVVPVEIGQFNTDLYSSVVWSKVGLLNFKQYKEKVFQEFEERELEFNNKYPKVTPFANQQIEMEYTKQVQFLGEEEEFNLEMFNLFDEGDIAEEETLVSGVSIPENVSRHYEGLEMEDISSKDPYANVIFIDDEDEEEVGSTETDKGISTNESKGYIRGDDGLLYDEDGFLIEDDDSSEEDDSDTYSNGGSVDLEEPRYDEDGFLIEDDDDSSYESADFTGHSEVTSESQFSNTVSGVSNFEKVEVAEIPRNVPQNPLQNRPVVSQVESRVASGSSSMEDILDMGIETKQIRRPKVNQQPKVQQVAPKVQRVEPKEPAQRGIVYYNGMSLRQFLRENPRSSIEVAEKYFSRKEIMKEVQLGRVIKRGKKLFI
jgi:hypothetical protein